MIRKVEGIGRREFVRMGALTISALASGRAWCAEEKERAKTPTSLFDGKTLNGWIQIENNDTKLSVGAIADPAAFTARLAHGQDPMSMFLRAQFDSLVKIDLTTYAASNANAAALLSAMVKQINQIVAGPSIFTPDRFRRSHASTGD